MNAVLYAAAGTGFTFLMTTLGAAVVFLFRKEHGFDKMQKLFMGFAAGAMMFVVADELIPEANSGSEHSNMGTIGVMAGFLIMMILDVALG